MNVLLSTALWVVGKALAPIADGMLGHWDASKNLGLNVEALGMELLLVKATLETASRKHIDGQAMEELLCKLQDSARCAEDLLDELDYYRIHDNLHGTYDAADQHAKGGVHNLALNARHTAQVVLGSSSAATPAEHGQVLEDARQQVGCCAWPRSKRSSRDTSSSAPNANQADQEEVSRCMPKLGKLLPCSSSPNVRDDNWGKQSILCGAPQREHAEETTILGFNRVDFSKRMKHIVDQLQPVRREFTNILQSCDHITIPDFAQSRPITTGRSIEPKLYGRDDIMNSFIHDMTKGKYHNKDLNVFPIVGPGGIGKTTMIQHIYHNEEVQKHFHVVIWVCVSLKFNLNKLLGDIKKDIPEVEGEKGYRPEDLIEQRLKSKRFLLVLDDIWECSNEDDWERLLLPLKKSQEKGSMVLVTTRFPAVAKMVGTTGHSIELGGLESKYFRELFHAFVFGDDQRRRDHIFLLDTGDKIMVKLKGSPLAAKTVGRLLRKDLNLRHWRRVLESKEWERQTSVNDIMPALKLSYDYLTFPQQQCFSYSALFPEDHKYSNTELINLWIGLDILQPDGRNQTLEDIEELKIFRVNKDSEGFEPKQLGHLTELRELGIYNLENIPTREEAARAKLIEKNYLERLTLDWDGERLNTDPGVQAAVLESLQPHRYLEELCIRGHRGPSFPTWLGDELAVEALESLHLVGVSWQSLPSLGRMQGLGKLILEHIAAIKEFVIEQSFCRLIRLELVGLGSFEKWVPSQDAHMFPILQVLIIRDCPKLLELPLSNHIVHPKPDQDWKIDWFPKLLNLKILGCPELLLGAHIPWTETLCSVNIQGVKLLENFEYRSKSYLEVILEIVGKGDLQSLDQVLAFSNLTSLECLRLKKCPPLELKHLLMLTSLERLVVESSNGLLGPLSSEGDVEWQHPVEHLVVQELGGDSGKELTELLTHLPRLSRLEIRKCENITQLAVGVDVQQQTTPAAVSEVKEEDDELLLFPTHLCDSLRELVIEDCPELVLVDPSTSLPARGGGGGRGFQSLPSLQILQIQRSSKVLSSCSFSHWLFPSSLQHLSLSFVNGMGTLEPLSNLTSLTQLDLSYCGEDLTCKGLGPLLTAGEQLRELIVFGNPRFFASWDLKPNRRLLQQVNEGGEELELVSKLQKLWTDNVMGLLTAPICSLLYSSLTELFLYGTCNKMERFSMEQEDAIHLLASLRRLSFSQFGKLQHLPAGLHKLTNLKKFGVHLCPAVRSLPKDGLPKSLQQLDVSWCWNEELKQQCKGLLGTIPEIMLDD
ncbi:hypothetical protein ACQ4PT_047714 [Festuca glaucescens]